MPLYLGLDAGKHSLTALVIEIEGSTRRIVFNRVIAFDRDLAEPSPAPLPLRWAHALDRVMGRLAETAEIDIERIRAISGAVDDHAEVEVPTAAAEQWRALRPSGALAPQLTRVFEAPYSAVTTPVTASEYLTSLLAGIDDRHARDDDGRRLAGYWRKRYSFPGAMVVASTGVSQASVIGTGVFRDGMLGVSLGTTDTVFSHGSPLHFQNGSIAREWMRVEYRVDWDAIGFFLESMPGNGGAVMLPWVQAETTPPVAHPGVRRFGFDRYDAATNVRGLIEGQMMAMANHATAMLEEPLERVIAIGSDARQREVLQVMANVFGADVYRLDTANVAALGTALRAYHADRLAFGEPVSWHSVISGFTDPNAGHRVAPNPRHVAIYAALRQDYAILEMLHQARPPIC
jgi:sugar (pentulose or hexulose) kinase